MFSCVAHAQHACCFLSTPNRDTLSALNIEPLSLDSPNSWCMSKTSLQIDPWPHRLDQLHQFHQPHGSTFTKVYLILFILNPIWPVPRTCNDTSTITNQPPRAFLAVWPCIIELFNYFPTMLTGTHPHNTTISSPHHNYKYRYSCLYLLLQVQQGSSWMISFHRVLRGDVPNNWISRHNARQYRRLANVDTQD